MDHPVGGPSAPRTLEFAPICKQLSVVLMAVYMVGFIVTWYGVWWDSLLGLGVALGGYYTLYDTNPVQLNARRVRYFHYGCIVSLLSHVVALGVTAYFVVKIYVLDALVSADGYSPGVTLFVFLFLFLALQIGITALVVERTHNLCAELARNDYFLLNDGRM